MRGEPHHSQCEMYVRNYSLLEGVAWEDRLEYLGEGEQEQAEAAPPTVPCDAWEYDTSSFQSTLISEVGVSGWMCVGNEYRRGRGGCRWVDVGVGVVLCVLGLIHRYVHVFCGGAESACVREQEKGWKLNCDMES